MFGIIDIGDEMKAILGFGSLVSVALGCLFIGELAIAGSLTAVGYGLYGYFYI